MPIHRQSHKYNNMKKSITINGQDLDIRYQAAKSKSNAAILFIPGISGELFTNRYDRFIKACFEAGYGFLGLQTWEDNGIGLDNKSISIIDKEISSAINYLQEKGYNRIAIVGKSFGGGMSLIYQHPAVRCMVLWAPAIGYGGEPNIAQLIDTPFANISSLLEFKVNIKGINSWSIPRLFIHGTADEVIPLENSIKLAHDIKLSTIKEINQAKHSFIHREEEQLLITFTMQFVESFLPILV